MNTQGYHPFNDIVLRYAEVAYKNKDWDNAIKYFCNYFQIFFLSIEQNHKEIDLDNSLKVCNYAESFYQFLLSNKSRSKIIQTYYQNITKYFTIASQIFDNDTTLPIDIFNKYIKTYLFLGQISIFFDKYDLAIQHFENGFEKALERPCNQILAIDLKFNIAMALEKQNKIQEAIDIIENALFFIDEELSNTDDEELNKSISSYKTKLNIKHNSLNQRLLNLDQEEETEYEEPENKKILREIIKSSISATTRPEWAPEEIPYKEHIYKFYYTRKHDVIYICKYGINKHKTNKIRCNAKIAILKPTFEVDPKQHTIKVIYPRHKCTEETTTIKKLISRSLLRIKVDEIYNSQDPRPTRKELLTKLYEWVNETTPEGEERPHFSEQFVHSCYTILEKNSKKEDSDFPKILKTKRKTNFELFKYRSHKENKDSLIICYCSDFQQSAIDESKYIFIDGTFDIAPNEFEQVLVISGQTKNMNLPLAYFLLPNKTRETYEKAFRLFKLESNAFFNPGTVFVTDFEYAEVQSVKNCLMDEDNYLQLCFFHFTQSMRRHFQKYPKSKLTNDLNAIANMLPFISEEKLIEVIDELFKYKQTKKFAKYFQKFYYNRYDFKDWSVYPKPKKETITNNVAESHNNVLRKRIGIKPSLETFEAKIKEIENEYYERYYNKQYLAPKITRVNQQTFNQKFKNFISEVRRLKDKSTFSDDEDDKRLKDDDDDDDYGDEFLKNDKGLSDDDDESIKNHQALSDDEYDDEFLKGDKRLKDDDDEFLKNDNGLSDIDDKSITNHNVLNADEYFKDQELSDTKNLDESDIFQEDNKNDHQNGSEKDEALSPSTKSKSSQKVNIRNLPENAQQILLANSIRFNNALAFSLERKQILENTYSEVLEIVPNITIKQIRSWFSNNKDKH